LTLSLQSEVGPKSFIPRRSVAMVDASQVSTAGVVEGFVCPSVKPPVGGYVVEFVCLKANLVVELDGGQHGDAAAVTYDRERTRGLERVGLRVLRVADDEMLRDPDAVLRTIYRELNAGEPSP
jgi:very-short-patch-repair endonuclease